QLIRLDEQDRAKWDRASIAAGTELIDRTIARGSVGPYQIQAAIAALHDAAPSTAATDWPQILALYDLLKRMGDHPMVELNRAVAYAIVHARPAPPRPRPAPRPPGGGPGPRDPPAARPPPPPPLPPRRRARPPLRVRGRPRSCVPPLRRRGGADDESP